MRTYDVLFILSPQVTEEEATTLINDFKGIATTNGATIKSEEPWGRRRLAYPIHKFNEGIYHLFVLETESGLSELDRRMKNVDRLLRHVIVRTDLDQNYQYQAFGVTGLGLKRGLGRDEVVAPGVLGRMAADDHGRAAGQFGQPPKRPRGGEHLGVHIVVVASEESLQHVDDQQRERR